MTSSVRAGFRSLALLAFALVGSQAHAACSSVSANDDLVLALEDATTAFGKLEIEAFETAAERARELVVCLGEPISRPTAAEYHRVMGVALFLSRNSPAAQKSFAAARSVEPDYTFPTDLVPEGNPIRDDYAALDPKVGPFELAVEPKAGSLRLNGSRSLNRAAPLPVIFQQLDGRGAVLSTVVVEGGAALPTYEMANVKPEKAPREQGAGPNKGLLAGAAAGVVVAGGLYGAALATKGAYGDSTTVSDLERRRKTTNALVMASGVIGVAAVGTGTTAFLVSGRF